MAVRARSYDTALDMAKAYVAAEPERRGEALRAVAATLVRDNVEAGPSLAIMQPLVEAAELQKRITTLEASLDLTRLAFLWTPTAPMVALLATYVACAFAAIRGWVAGLYVGRLAPVSFAFTLKLFSIVF